MVDDGPQRPEQLREKLDLVHHDESAEGREGLLRVLETPEVGIPLQVEERGYRLASGQEAGQGCLAALAGPEQRHRGMDPERLGNTPNRTGACEDHGTRKYLKIR